MPATAIFHEMIDGQTGMSLLRRMPNGQGKHVIILGAGASATSGYPIASKLRLLTSSPSHLEREIKSILGFENNSGLVGFSTLFSALQALLEQHRKAISLFRTGCFASLDEFCKLMDGGGQSEIVRAMRQLTYLALALHNPEANFEASDYYAFVQKLFMEDLRTLRHDVTVMSFNYDVYLESLLIRAWETRNDQKLSQLERNFLTGGFADQGNLDWLSSGSARFRFFKLHGSLDAWPTDDGRPPSLGGGTINGITNLIGKVSYFGDVSRPAHDPHVYFPWQGSKNHPLSDAQDGYHGVRKKLIDPVWDFATKEIASAQKISLVGLSMNPLLDEGFMRLFSEVGQVGLVINGPIPRGEDRRRYVHELLPPTHPAYRATKLVATSWTRAKQRPLEELWKFSIVDRSPSDRQVRILSSFKDFIQEELGPTA